MQKTKKQLLGFASLAAVGVMTAVACAMPAAAAEDIPASANGDVNLTVTVRSGVNSARILSPLDRSVTVNPVVPISYQYEETVNVKTYIEYRDKNGNIVRELVDDFSPAEGQVVGNRSFDVNVTRFSDEEKDYKVVTVSTDQYGATNEDTVTFSYRAVSAEFEKQPASNGDPIIDITVNSEVDQVLVYVYDKTGKPLFVDKEGNEVPIVLSRKDIDPATGKITKILPFGDAEAADGTYTAVVVARSDEGNTISMITIDTDYAKVKPVTPVDPENPDEPGTPDTPNTGFTIGDLNISRVDYLITGLIVFGMVSAFALFLVHRKSRR